MATKLSKYICREQLGKTHPTEQHIGNPVTDIYQDHLKEKYLIMFSSMGQPVKEKEIS